MTKKASSTSAKKVFIVDDHPVFRDGLVRIAAAIPGVVVCGEADNARDAFDSISKLNPHLVLMDINLPGMSGFEALDALRDDARTRQVPVVALTAAASDRDKQRGAQAGFYRYLTKPIQVDELYEAFESLERERIA